MPTIMLFPAQLVRLDGSPGLPMLADVRGAFCRWSRNATGEGNDRPNPPSQGKAGRRP